MAVTGTYVQKTSNETGIESEIVTEKIEVKVELLMRMVRMDEMLTRLQKFVLNEYQNGDDFLDAKTILGLLNLSHNVPRTKKMP